MRNVSGGVKSLPRLSRDVSKVPTIVVNHWNLADTVCYLALEMIVWKFSSILLFMSRLGLFVSF
jgi:hypothetical protein